MFAENEPSQDKSKEEIEYFKKIKESMKNAPATKENLTSQEKKEVETKTRPRLKIDYFSYIKIIFVLAIVIFIIYFLAYLMKKFLFTKGEIGEGINVIVSHSVAPGKWLQVVNIFGKYLVLGITNENINVLTEITDPKEIERIEVILNTKKAEEGHSFIDIVTDILKGKFKKQTKIKEKFDFDYESDSLDFLKKQKERLEKIKNGDDDS